MKVALTGASGFLGPGLVQGLLERGHQVHILSRNVEHALARLPAGVTGAPFDAGSPLPPEALADAEAVVHLAGEPVAQRWTREGKHRIHDSRVLGTRAVVAAMRGAGTVRRFVSASAIGYYGGTRGADPLTEESPPGDDFLARVCVDWEAEAMQARESGIATAVVRMGVVLHPDGGALHKMLPPFRVGAGGPVGSGEQFVSWVHRDDARDLLLFLLAHPQVEGMVNATAPTPVTNAFFAHTLGHVLGRPSMVRMPAFMLKAALGEMAKVVLEGQRVLPQRAHEAGFVFRYTELEGALRDLLA
ncbi:TIGR01777 family oxidoreductase [Myxococcus xanthus]|uniref:TIGR01777 family protein n=1 Tax=Myxococcus xanthus TaxID=34 RepID=A0AAE6KQL5_MYXXA|nr:TIGR01777 family oxidoreductase [Myxococcus xanthus]QDE66338.1 TIGR01777 family protein [Myxococcus xanthus]QDE73611.1 TIGR01777 family protein [Myxococcus xanthus]QDE95207.1 TIGR01777 family protein [Myxococcus xanthus]QDF02481.1 TIGR01777 family protein [Myxococcus xanthus]